jgi:hypothetical protein
MKTTYREHEEQTLKFFKLQLFQTRIREPMNNGAADRAKLQEQEPFLFFMVITDFPLLKPILNFLFIHKQCFVEMTRTECVGVKDPIDKVCRVVGAPGKEPNHHYTFQGARMGLG